LRQNQSTGREPQPARRYYGVLHYGVLRSPRRVLGLRQPKASVEPQPRLRTGVPPRPRRSTVPTKDFVQCGVTTGGWRVLRARCKRRVARWTSILPRHRAAVLEINQVRFTPTDCLRSDFTCASIGRNRCALRITTITFQRDVKLGIEFPRSIGTTVRVSLCTKHST